MSRHRDGLPQLEGKLFLTDGGIETTLIFRDRLSLPHFAAFVLLGSAEGRAALRRYFVAYAALARRYGVGCVLESATWRASADWGEKLGYSSEALREANMQAVALLHEIREEHEGGPTMVVASGCIGPRGDGYAPASMMTEDEARRYHSLQAEAFRDAGADMVTAITMTYPAEAVGLVRAARDAGMPVAVSFTVETDGRLPSGHSLREAVERVDGATGGAAAYYMINCAHPTHFAGVLEPGEPWAGRIRGVRANASAKSHTELNEATELDDGDPVELGWLYNGLRARLPGLTILGGCCGTDERHVEEICKACLGGPA